MAACIGEVYAAVGSEEVSLSEGMLARMNEGSDATASKHAHPHSQPGAEDDEWMDDETKECLQSQVREPQLHVQITFCPQLRPQLHLQIPL